VGEGSIWRNTGRYTICIRTLYIELYNAEVTVLSEVGGTCCMVVVAQRTPYAVTENSDVVEGPQSGSP
jgi:hypothetical protein